MKDIQIKDIRSILSQAKTAMGQIEHGRELPVSYVLDRFIQASYKHPTDQLIGNMRDVLMKRANKQSFFTEQEITACYDKMYGISGGQTAFRDELGDLLLVDPKLSKTAYSSSSRRGSDEGREIKADTNEDLSNAFASIFDLGNNNSFGTYNLRDKKEIEMLVVAKLNAMGMQPNDVILSESNEHFVLATAVYNTNSLNKVAVHIPVQISNGKIPVPTQMISDGAMTDLNRANLLVHLKMSENQIKTSSRQAFSGQHGSKDIVVDRAVTPAALTDFTDLENQLVVAASNYTKEQVMMASSMLSAEFKAVGVVNPQIKVASSDNKMILFNISIPTIAGRSNIHVPVEFHNKKPILPSRFITSNDKKESIYDFTVNNINNFIKNASHLDLGVTQARQTGELSKMSYHQLVDRIIEGVATEDYKLA